jgi:mRNA interferase RelE/StbE
MARYEIRVKPSVAKDLRGIPRADVERILARIDGLRDDPRPPGSEKLSARERYRVRQGQYRILYSVADVLLIVEVVKVGHRRDVYRDTQDRGRAT